MGLRKGKYGDYYGSAYDESESIPALQMMVNASYIYKYLSAKGWTKNAVAGMLGNLEVESTLNPGRWQSDNVGNTSGGYGLVQWTPATNYLNWCNDQNLSDPSTMDNNLARIIYELDHGLQWIATSEYNLSFKEFTKSNASPEYLASAFLKCYERAGVEVEDARRSNAIAWLDWLQYETPGVEVPDYSGTTTRNFKNGFKFYLLKNRRKGQTR